MLRKNPHRSVVLTDDLAEALNKYAAQNHTTASQAIRQFIENEKITDGALSRDDMKAKAKERRYKRAKHFSEQFFKNWWLIYAIINIYSVVNLIVIAINSRVLHLPVLSDITLIVGLTLLSGLSLAFLADVVACRIVDKYEGN